MSMNDLLETIIESCEELSVLLSSHCAQADLLLDVEETLSRFFSLCENFVRTPWKVEGHFDQKTLRGRSRLKSSQKRAYRLNRAVRHVLKQLDGLYSFQPKLQSDELSHSCRDLANFLVAYLLEGRAQNKYDHTGIYQPPSNVQEDPKFELTLEKLKEGERQGRGYLTPATKGVRDHEDLTEIFPFLFSKQTSGIYKVLVVGKEGAGKTHLCNEIERRATGNTRVHRPQVVGRKTGELEDNIHALILADRAEEWHHILLVDNLDDLVSSTESGGKSEDNLENHTSARALFAFLSGLDSICMSCLNAKLRITLICTTRYNANQSLVRFDTVYTLSMPNYDERRRAISNLVGHHNHNTEKDLEIALDHLAELSIGLSHAEIAQTCREVLSDIEQAASIMAKDGASDWNRCSRSLEALKARLQSFTPASLRSGVVADYVDMRVLKGEDLLEPALCPPKRCPLFGKANELAWKELESNIVIPLCRAKNLNQLLFDKVKSSVEGGLSCGVVLTGPPGSGKSQLARHCASFAASFLPAMKLLEVSCTSMIHKEVGASEKAIRHLFDCARSAAPCIVILDDVATIASVRGKVDTTEGTMDRVLSTLLTELDGVEKRSRAPGDSGAIAVIGITQNVSWVDPALLRPGRFSRVVRLESPDREAKQQIALREVKSNFHGDPDDEEYEGVVSELAVLIANQVSGTTGSSVVALFNDAKQSCVAKFSRSSEPFPSSASEILRSIRSYLLSKQSSTTS